jgi:hypothetical protein
MAPIPPNARNRPGEAVAVLGEAVAVLDDAVCD